MELVEFISIDCGDDLIVAFAVADGAGGVVSFIMMRTPKYEGLLPPDERGVHVSHEDSGEDDDEWLKSITFTSDRVEVTSDCRDYAFDVSRVDDAEIISAAAALEKMNFDGRFALQVELP